MSAGGVRLGAVTKELWVQWQQTKQSWQDAKAEEFERRFLSELFSSVDRTVNVIDQLDKLMAKVKHDCE